MESTDPQKLPEMEQLFADLLQLTLHFLTGGENVISKLELKEKKLSCGLLAHPLRTSQPLLKT